MFLSPTQMFRSPIIPYMFLSTTQMFPLPYKNIPLFNINVPLSHIPHLLPSPTQTFRFPMYRTCTCSPLPHKGSPSQHKYSSLLHKSSPLIYTVYVALSYTKAPLSHIPYMILSPTQKFPSPIYRSCSPLRHKGSPS